MTTESSHQIFDLLAGEQERCRIWTIALPLKVHVDTFTD